MWPLLPEDLAVRCFAFDSFPSRLAIVALSRSSRDQTIQALEDVVIETLMYAEYLPSHIDTGTLHTVEVIQARTQRLLDNKPVRLGTRVYDWYEAQVRLMLLSGRHFNGISPQLVANRCFVAMGRPHLQFCKEEGGRKFVLPCVQKAVCRAMAMSTEMFTRRKKSHMFSGLVETRDMGADDLGFSLMEVLVTIADLGEVYL